MSSGFKENFERGEKESLDYDDSAFYYFSLALLLLGLVPATWYMIIKPIIFGEISINYTYKTCKCNMCVERMTTRAKFYQFSWLNKFFILKLVCISIGWYMTYICFDAVKDIEPLKNFIPHEILGIDSKATVAQVKKAYRAISREKHPDKNPDNPEAVNEFIQITKAYTVSTQILI
jgi:translocation protein SEC63